MPTAVADHWGYSDAHLVELGKLVVSMTRCEGMAALLANLTDPSRAAPWLLAKPSRLDDYLRRLGSTQLVIAELAARLRSLRADRNRIIHDVGGLKQWRDNVAHPIVLRTGDDLQFVVQDLPSAVEIAVLANRADELCRAFGQHLNQEHGTVGWIPARNADRTQE